MQLLVNDEPRAIRIEPRQTLRQVAQSICRDGDAKHCLIVSVECDGQTVPLERLDSALDTPAEQYQQVAFQTQPMVGLIAQSLGEAIAVFRAANHTRIEVADLLAARQQKSALENLGRLLGDWKQVQETIALVLQAIGPQGEDPIDNGRTIQNVLGDITRQLRDLKAALETGDLVLVGDILRFELEGPFEDWIAAMEGLLRSQATVS